MHRRFLFLLALCLLASIPARAQSVDIFGGYSYLRFEGTPAGNYNGWELAGQYKVRKWLGGIVDVSGDYGSPTGVTSSVRTYMVGPQVSFPWRITPFAHVIGGLGQFTQGNVDKIGLGYGYGAGIDMKIAPRISWRILQGDEIETRFFGKTQGNLRFSSGIVFHF